MAAIQIVLIAECDLIRDATDDIEHVFRALAKRHGARFRALERRIEALVEDGANFEQVKSHDLGEGRILLEPPAEMKAIIREARVLGLIGP